MAIHSVISSLLVYLDLYLHGKSQIVILGPNSIELIRRNLDDEATQLEMLKALGFGTKQFLPSFVGVTSHLSGYCNLKYSRCLRSESRIILLRAVARILFLTRHDSSWWFRFIFAPRSAEMIQFHLRIFFLNGWFNHQLEDFLACHVLCVFTATHGCIGTWRIIPVKSG